MAKGSLSIGKIAVWTLLGLLVVGLIGFGPSTLSGNLRTLGKVGDKYVDIEQYARLLQQEIQATQAQLGSPVTFARARELGIDQRVLATLVRQRALDHEAGQMGLSVGDSRVRDEVLSIPNFQGINGEFDREAYSYALDRLGMTETEFEDQLREDNARIILQRAVAAGTTMPQTYADTLAAFALETRNFTWTRLAEDALETPVATPSESDLQTFYDANIDRYQLPETKRLTVVSLLPEDLVDEVEIDTDALRTEYEARAEIYDQPERRLVERLAFLDDAAATAAAGRITDGSATFEDLVEERGLTLPDVDLGDVTEATLGDAGAPIFGADVGTVVGPYPSDLGPALFRVNGVLPAQFTAFEEAEAELRGEMAMDRARRLVEAQAQDLDDLLAGGTTLEQLADESNLTIAQVDWYEGQSDGIAAYAGFRQAANAVAEGDFPQVEVLSEGGVFALRLDETLPARPAPLADVQGDVETDWRDAQVRDALTAQAEPLIAELAAGKDFAELGMQATAETELQRTAFVEETPPDFMTTVFGMQPGDVRQVGGGAVVTIVRLDEINAASENDEARALARQLTAQISQSLAQDLFGIYTVDTLNRAGPQIDQRAVDAVHANFQY